MEESHPHRALIEISTLRIRNMLKTALGMLSSWRPLNWGGATVNSRLDASGRKITSPIHAGGPRGERSQGTVSDPNTEPTPVPCDVFVLGPSHIC